ncbi:hypothetical protein N7470_007378 [Penicillium chermesinum]|nr:hypothetical protein N7470_007378 [Penicillium chermesinum]
MDEHASSALHYGHVGRAIYQPETSSWSFSRSFTRGSSLTYTGVTNTTIHSPRDTSKSRGDAVVWPTVHEDKFSQFVSSASEYYDPNVSTLLDLGYALHSGYDDAKVRPRPMMIAAAVTGECRNVISFRVLAEGQAELTQERLAVRVPVIDDAEATEWSTEGAQIHQICFARPMEDDEEKTTWMAARLSESTAIFKPFYQRDPVPMHLRRDDPWALPTPPHNSRLDANPVVEILASYTGGSPHADVAFNPWYQRQLAIVDNKGSWSIWELTGRQKRRKAHWLAIPGQTGKLPSDDDLKSNGPKHDGWASIQWIADYSVILVADRTCAMLFRLGGSETRSTVVKLNMGRKSEWVLDVQRSTHSITQFFILTTSRILWFDLTGVSLDGEAMHSAVRPSLTWRHFRDPEDISLRCNDLLIGGALHIVLYSRLTQLVQVFPCPSLSDEQEDSIAVSDPFLLHVPSASDASDVSKKSRFSTFVFREVAHSPGAHPQKQSRYNPDMTLIKLFWIDSSLAVHETLYKGPDRKQHDENIDTQDNTSVLRVKKHAAAHRKDTEIDEDDDFIVEDWDESVFGPSRASLPRSSRVSPFAGLEWTVDWSYIYMLALKGVLTTGNGAWLDQTMETLKGQDNANFAPGRVVKLLSDLRSAAVSLSKRHCRVWAARFPQQFMILPLKLSDVFAGIRIISGQDPSKLDFLDTYDRLVHEWLANLPRGFPMLFESQRRKRFVGLLSISFCLV